MLIASLRVIAQRGMRVGHDISIVTVDDSPWASAFSPGIAVVARPVEEVGEAAVRLLLERIADPGHDPATVTLPTEFIPRVRSLHLRRAPRTEYSAEEIRCRAATTAPGSGRGRRR